MKLDVSIGEAIDKYSILQIKQTRITDENKLKEIQNELNQLKECIPYIEKEVFYYNLLLYFNTEIWNKADEIKGMDVSNANYSIIAKNIFDNNQKRFRVKNMLNRMCSSTINEQKSYGDSYCKLIIENEAMIYDKIPEINYLLFEYDCLFVDEQYISIFKSIFKHHTILDNTCTNSIDLKDFTINESIRKTFTFSPMTYMSFGRLGDFIQSLYVVSETFYKTGRKGTIYITNGQHDEFPDCKKTLNDTYEIITSQKYVHDYCIYQGEHIDIDLNKWRYNHSLLYNTNWIQIYSDNYNVKWGSHKWFHVPHDNKWEHKILINVMNYRKSNNIDWNMLYSKYTDKLVFISFDTIDYDEFIKDTHLTIPHYIPDSFTDICIAVNSCELLVAALSGILTIGHACHKKRVIGLHGSCDDIHNKNFTWTNVYYDVASL